MQVKTFLGKDAASVLAQVKAEMGPDAVILASRDVSKGSVRLHEVTAGIERLEVQSEDFFGQNYSANGAGFEVYADGKNQSASLGQTGQASHASQASQASQAGQAGQASSAQAAGFGFASGGSGLPPGWRQWHNDWNSLRDHILALMRPDLHLENLAPRQRMSLEYLQREGVDDEVIITLYRNLLANSEQSVLGPLGEIVKVRPWGYEHWKNKVHLVVGPFGCGKTVTALRMGLALKDEKPNSRIAIVNADCERGHGRLILKHYCELLDVEYHEARNSKEMRDVLISCKDADRIMVDLPGLASSESLPEVLGRLGLTGKASMHLVLAPHYAPKHLRGLLTAYAAERCSSLIWTKLDEAFSYGALINAASTCKLPVSAISFASGLTNSLLPAQASHLWKILFKHQLPENASELNAEAV